VTIGHLHGLDHLPPDPRGHWTRPGVAAKQKLRSYPGITAKAADEILDAVERRLEKGLSETTDGDPIMPMEGELAPAGR
jgi:hypothetical protein